MAIQFFVFDTTGNAGRRAGSLAGMIKAKGFSVVCNAIPVASEESVLLCHERDQKDLAETVPELSEQARLVILYSDGPLAGRDEGGVHYRALAEVEHLLGLLQPTWGLEQFAALLDQSWLTTRQHGFSALAILAQCAGADSASSPTTRRRQESWRREPKNWRRVLSEIPLTALRECAHTERKPEVEKLVNWILGSEDVPDFLRAAEEASALA